LSFTFAAIEALSGIMSRSPEMSASGLGRVKTPTFNLRVEIPSRFRKFENQKRLRPLLREDDRENNSAHSWLVHVFTQPGSKSEKLNASKCFPLCLTSLLLLELRRFGGAPARIAPVAQPF